MAVCSGVTGDGVSDDSGDGDDIRNDGDGVTVDSVTGDGVSDDAINGDGISNDDDGITVEVALREVTRIHFFTQYHSFLR